MIVDVDERFQSLSRSVPVRRKFSPRISVRHISLEPDAPAADEKQQWDNVKGKWESPDWRTGDDGQAGFVDIWAREFGWRAENDGCDSEETG
ncbi:hypothetical protein V8E54_009053 [Elaphomyces granulatus]